MMHGETVLSGARHPGTALEVMTSDAGWYLGFRGKDGFPYTRETIYLPTKAVANSALTMMRGYEP